MRGGWSESNSPPSCELRRHQSQRAESAAPHSESATPRIATPGRWRAQQRVRARGAPATWAGAARFAAKKAVPQRRPVRTRLRTHRPSWCGSLCGEQVEKLWRAREAAGGSVSAQGGGWECMGQQRGGSGRDAAQCDGVAWPGVGSGHTPALRSAHGSDRRARLSRGRTTPVGASFHTTCRRTMRCIMPPGRGHSGVPRAHDKTKPSRPMAAEARRHQRHLLAGLLLGSLLLLLVEVVVILKAAGREAGVTY